MYRLCIKELKKSTSLLCSFRDSIFSAKKFFFVLFEKMCQFRAASDVNSASSFLNNKHRILGRESELRE